LNKRIKFLPEKVGASLTVKDLMLMGFTYIPDNEGVVVLSTKRGEVLLILREGERLDQDLMELEAMNHLKSIEVPNDDIRLNITR